MLLFSAGTIFLPLLNLGQLTAALGWVGPTRTGFSRPASRYDDYGAPMRTSAPDFSIQGRQSSGNQVCGVFSGNSDYSAHTYTCQSNEACLVAENWWGCCAQTPVPGCYEWACPTVSSCVEYGQLTRCDQNCAMDSNILKWWVIDNISFSGMILARAIIAREPSLAYLLAELIPVTHPSTNINSPYCAVANAASIVSTEFALIEGSSPTLAGQQFFACEQSQYNLDFIVTATESGPEECAPPWATNPASLSAWSVANPSQAHSFGDPFISLVVRSGVKMNATTSLPSVQWPTLPTAAPAFNSTSSTTSGGAEVTVVAPHRMVICGVAAVLAFITW